MSADDGHDSVPDNVTITASDPHRTVASEPTTTSKRKASPVSSSADSPATKRSKTVDGTQDTADGPRHSSEPQFAAQTLVTGQQASQWEDITGPAGEALIAEAPRSSLSGSVTNRRQDLSQEEKKRGRRLFGGLLSTLSQTTANSQHKRRLEIERRQNERAQQQRAEQEQRIAQRLARVDRVRKIEQVDFDERVMQTRHSHLLAHAHHLKTSAEPVLYYRPWQLTDAQNEMLESQILAARDQVDKEREEFRQRKQARLKELGIAVPLSRPETATGDASRPRSNHSSSDAANLRIDPVRQGSQSRSDRPHEDQGDLMVEGEEDTVIY